MTDQSLNIEFEEDLTLAIQQLKPLFEAKDDFIFLRLDKIEDISC